MAPFFCWSRPDVMLHELVADLVVVSLLVGESSLAAAANEMVVAMPDDS